MPKENSMTAFYNDESLPAPVSDYWQQRRRFANNIRALQERIQTTKLSIEDLETLNLALENQLQSTPDAPKLEGRQAWTDAEEFGDFGTIHTEITSIVGPSNPITPGLSIWFKDEQAFAKVTFNWMYEGNKNIAHGGWIAAVFDEFLGTAQVLSGKTGMTGTLSVSYHKPTPLNKELRLTSAIKFADDRKTRVVAEMWAGDVKTASAEGLFITPSKKNADFLGG